MLQRWRAKIDVMECTLDLALNWVDACAEAWAKGQVSTDPYVLAGTQYQVGIYQRKGVEISGYASANVLSRVRRGSISPNSGIMLANKLQWFLNIDMHLRKKN